MVQILVVFACVLLAVSAAPYFGYSQYQYPQRYGYYGSGYAQPFHYYGYGQFPFGVSPYDRWIYYGSYAGSCEGAHDGLYYVDEYNFAYCSNGQKTIQPCAEGSANPPVTHYTSGAYYGFYDFCSVNLVALGYNDNQGRKHLPAHPEPAVVEKEVHNGDPSTYEHGENKEHYGNEEKVHVVDKFYEGAGANMIGGYEVDGEYKQQQYVQ